ncbi:aspartate-semialdehyde dehydrogenase [Candidatus Vidania fulgoroideorum]
MKKIALLGPRGLVGKTFIQRFKKNKIKMKLYCFGSKNKYKNHFKSYNLNIIKKFKIVVCCKDNIFSKNFYKKLKKKKWNGYWIDASSNFRLSKKSVLVLDPINKKKIIKEIKKGKKIFSGCNCTVSILLISICNFVKKNMIKSIICNTYQSISGSGYKETYKFFKNCFRILKKIFSNKNFFKNLNNNINNKIIKKKDFLSFSLCPWIGEKGIYESSEEKKSYLEAEKIIGKKININSTCVRTNSYRCHSEAITINLKKKIKMKKFYKIIKSKYVKVIKNNEKDTKEKLNPLNVSGKNFIYVGRIKKINRNSFSIFVIGDQLIWGAAEPLVRILKLINNAY